VHLVRNVLDEVFGSGNFCADTAFLKTSGATSELLAGVFDHVLWYARDRDRVKFRRLFSLKVSADDYGQYTWVDDGRGSIRPTRSEDSPSLRRARHDNLRSQRPPGDYPVELEGRMYRPATGYWKTN